MSANGEEARQGRAHGTDPKTAAGKARSARNALKHGLSAKKIASRSANDRIAELAAIIAKAVPATRAAAEIIQRAAESQYHIEQVRCLKAESLTKHLVREVDLLAGSSSDGPCLRDWERLERYERRAFSRRQRAFRQLDRHITTAASGCQPDTVR